MSESSDKKLQRTVDKVGATSTDQPVAAGLPKDGPATTFWVDPALPRIAPYVHYDYKIQSGDYTAVDPGSGDDFSCVLVTMWPPPLDDFAPRRTTLRDAYTRFIEKVKGCFDPRDLAFQLFHAWDEEHDIDSGKKKKKKPSLPRAYLYMPQTLHITVATFHRFDVPATEAEQKVMQKVYTDLIQRATKNTDWPGKGNKMQFTVESAQIGAKAGILVWKELTGNLQKIRGSIQREYDASYGDIVKAVGEDHARCFTIPNIVHSTFLRFSDTLISNGAEVQEKFSKVLVKEIFVDCTVEADTADTLRLACERRPYMHIPCDEEHVFDTIRL